MNVKKYQLENYRKHLLNRVTVTPHFIEYVENCLASEDEAAHHSFHKIMVHNWTGSSASMFDTIAEYFAPTFIPVNYTSQGSISTFYTSSLGLVLKITKLDFMFPHQRNMFSVDILFNDKTSADCFENRITIEDTVSGVVSNRLNEKFELNLSDFCNDPEFLQKKIHFYKINLLSQFKILMLRMGRDTRTLNLSNNNLSQVPIDILNFFIKGNLVAVNLSNNNLQSIQEIRVSSKIEKLWVEGNPLCDDLDPVAYVRQITAMFPRLTELDGIKLNANGILLPFFKNYLVTPDKRTKMLVEKFLTLYFTCYDSLNRKRIEQFYDENCFFTLATNFPATETKTIERYENNARNLLNPKDPVPPSRNANRQYKKRESIRGLMVNLPASEHDPTTFTVDVLRHDKKGLVLVVDGVFREEGNEITAGKLFHFRRTFVLEANNKNNMTEYFIKNEMFNLSFATKEMVENSFKNPTRGTNPMALQNPDAEDISAVCNVFSHITQLKKYEAEWRLKKRNYDINRALKDFLKDMKLNKISPDMFYEEEDFSDTSSLIDDDLDSS